MPGSAPPAAPIADAEAKEIVEGSRARAATAVSLDEDEFTMWDHGSPEECCWSSWLEVPSRAAPVASNRYLEAELLDVAGEFRNAIVLEQQGSTLHGNRFKASHKFSL